MIRRHELSDAEWAFVQPLLPRSERGSRRLDEGRVLNGIVWKFRTGTAWRDVPERYGSSATLHTRLCRWAKDGTFERMLRAAQARADAAGDDDFDSHHDQLLLVMEFVDGWSLAQERRLRGVLALPDAAAIAAQMAAGLSAAHRRGVIHRDVKPANVMLTADRTVKIGDFGIARFADDATSTLTAQGKILGTADYLAPERALGRTAQPASDVYSLGCVLYELLTGRPPFSGPTSLAVVKQHTNATPPPPNWLRPEIPQPLSDYLLRLLAKDPARRPTAEQAADWLTTDHRTPARVEPDGTAPMPAPRTPPAPATRRDTARTAAHSRPRRHRKLVSKAALYGTGLALFASAAALGASLSSGDDTPPPSPTPTPGSGTSVPAGRTPTATPPPATASAVPAATAPPAGQHGDDKGHEQGGKHGDT